MQAALASIDDMRSWAVAPLTLLAECIVVSFPPEKDRIMCDFAAHAAVLLLYSSLTTPVGLPTHDVFAC